MLSSEFPPGPGGIGHHALSLVTALHGEGYSITVLCSGDYATQDEIRQFDVQLPFPIIRFKRTGKFSTYIQRWRLLKHVLSSKTFDTILLTGKFSLWLGYLLKITGKKVKTLAILHGSEVNLPNPWLRRFTHKSIAAADMVVSVSRYTQSLLPDFILNRKTNLHIIPNGVHPLAPKEKIEKLTLHGNPALLTIGHVSKRKGQHRVIQALPVLQSVFPNVHYHLVGRPIEQKAFELVAEKLGVRHRITFHGAVKKHADLGAYYKAADIFMLLSENQPNGDVEGFGIVALEANQQGLPVVGAKFCGVEDAVSEGISGYLVDGDNVSEITQAVDWCIQNRENLAVGASHWAEAHDWEKIVQSYVSLLQ